MNDNLKERLTDMSVLASSRTPADALQYIEELEAEIADLKAKLATCKKYRDAYAECDRIATQAVRDLDAKLSESEALLAEAVDEKLDAIDTLNAWFDRRKLAHDAVDQAVIDAASGYLRTSRVGGMSQKKSDLVLGVIQDMARLSVFADLFARTTIAELTSSEAADNEVKGGKDE